MAASYIAPLFFACSFQHRGQVLRVLRDPYRTFSVQSQPAADTIHVVGKALLWFVLQASTAGKNLHGPQSLPLRMRVLCRSHSGQQFIKRCANLALKSLEDVQDLVMLFVSDSHCQQQVGECSGATCSQMTQSRPDHSAGNL